MPRISTEAAIGFSLEIAVIFLHRLHLRDPRIVFSVFELGVLLIADRIARGEWAETIFHPERRRKKRVRIGIAAAIVFAFFGWWVVRLPAEAKEIPIFGKEAEQTLPASPTPKPNPAHPCRLRKTRPGKPIHTTGRGPVRARMVRARMAREKIPGVEQNKSPERESANQLSFP